jgi:sulfur carrier protein ThiS
LATPAKDMSTVKSLIKDVFIWVSIQLKISITILPKNISQNVEIKSGETMAELIKKLNFLPDNIIILRDNTPVPVDDVITDDKELTIIEVASGG